MREYRVMAIRGFLRDWVSQSLTTALVLVYLLCASPPTCVWAASAASDEQAQASDLLTHLTFVSCNRQSRDQSFWVERIAPTIAAQQASEGGMDGAQAGAAKPHTDLLLWLGNAVYADVEETGVARRTAQPLAGIEREYKVLTENRHYRQFIEEVIGGDGRVMGIWDDRDLGLRWADGAYNQTEAARRLYLSHIWRGFPVAARDATGEGAPGSLFAFAVIPTPASSPLSAFFANSMCIVTLDVRTRRTAPPNMADALLRGNEEAALRAFGHNSEVQAKWRAEARRARAKAMEADLLGAAQWHWLEDILATRLAPSPHSRGSAVSRDPCAVTIFASPWQLLLNDNKPFEGWDLYPASRSRLLLLLKRYGIERFIFLSGHAELGELGVLRRTARKDLRFEGPTATFMNSFPIDPTTASSAKLLPALPSYLVEMTSSGLTHTVSDAPLVGRLARWITTPHVTEDKSDNGLMKRHVLLSREVTTEHHFGTAQLRGEAAGLNRTREEVLHSTKLILTLHRTMRTGSPLIVFERALADLPTYAVRPMTKEEAEEEERMAAVDLHDVQQLPVFSMYNLPGDYPWLKRWTVERQCVEVPCTTGQHFMLVKIALNLFLAFALVLGFIAAVHYYQTKHPERFEDEAIKLKAD